MVEKYLWCAEYQAVYTDDAGKEYCVFHAPQGKKGYELNQFNIMVFKVIRESYEGGCALSGTVFEGDIEFGGQVNRLAYIRLDDAVFNGEVRFVDSVFRGDAQFTGAQFRRTAYFQRAIFNKYTNFFGARFYDDAYFGWANFRGLTWFHQTKFNKVAAFDNAVIDGAIEYWQTMFCGRVNFLCTAFNSKAYFADSKFSAEVIFQGASVKERVDFRGRTFERDCSFQNLNIDGKIRFEGVNCRTISFLDTDLRRIDFVNCDWLKAGQRNILFDEQVVSDRLDERSSARYSKVGSLYRKLKQKYKEEHDETEASNWHYGEKNMFRLSNKWRRFLPSVTTLYWMSSGYGERPVRAGLALVAWLMLCSCAMLFSGISFADGYTENLYGITEKELSAGFPLKAIGPLLLNTVKYALFQKDAFFQPTNWWGELVKLSAQIVIPIQAALFGLALRNRFRR